MTAIMKTRVVSFWLVASLVLLIAGVSYAETLPTPSLSISASPSAASPGDTVQLTFSIDPNGSEGESAEWWIMAKAPSGIKYYLSGGTWYTDARAFSLADMAVYSKTVTSPVLNESGSWLFYFALDGVKDGSVAGDALAATCSVSVSGGGGALPTAGISASGSATQGGTVNLSLSMDAGGYSGYNVEWWLVAYSPAGAKMYHNGSGWSSTKTPYDTSSLSSFSGVIVSSPTLSWTGSWKFYFGIDGVINGAIDDAYYNSTTVSVGGTLPTWSIHASASKVSPGDTVDLDLSLFAADYAGVAAELWLVAVTPGGEKLYYNGLSGHWTPTTVLPFMTGPLADLDQIIASFPLNNGGTYSFYFGADDDINSQVDKPEWLVRAQVHVGEVPHVRIWANGYENSTTIARGGSVTLSIGLDPGTYDGANADWWVVGISPFGMTYSFNSVTNVWTGGFATFRQAPLTTVAQSTVCTVTLEDAGTYHFYFGVDDPNNYVDQPIYQEVTVYVN